jgi:replication initiation and membrane attachment protein DnaB
MKLVVDNKNSKERMNDVYLLTKEFNTPSEFSQFIEKTSYSTRQSCMDVLIDYCEKKEIDLEGISRLLSASLKEKIRVEAQDLNLLKGKENKLPI